MFLPKGKLTPLTYSQVASGLIALGFNMEPKKGTAHEQWSKMTDKGLKRVTVDKHIAPFNVILIKLMAKQAGLTAHEFHLLCKSRQARKEWNLSQEI